jgi:uncharacterized surface protein with fasciclin (FAS1) repeats
LYNNTHFTSTLFKYFNTTNIPSVTPLLSSSNANITVFAVNDSAYAALNVAETAAYNSVKTDSLKYLVVNGSLSLKDLQASANMALTTYDGPEQLILVTTANNQTVLNQRDSCSVSTCSAAGTASVCLVGCVLAPTDGLGTIAIIGIVVAGVAAACLIVACIFNIFRKDPETVDDNADDTYQAVDDPN